MIHAISSAKKFVGVVLTALATAGISPKEASDFAQIVIGLFVGTLARMSYDYGKDGKLPPRYLLTQVGFWGLITVFLLFVADSRELPAKSIPVMAGVAAFAVREWLANKLVKIKAGEIG